jgi:hypothetical protein
MTSPTKIAEDSFKFAKSQLQAVKANSDDMHPQLRSALMNMCWGFENFSIGLRATYIKLEQVEKELQKLNLTR